MEFFFDHYYLHFHLNYYLHLLDSVNLLLNSECQLSHLNRFLIYRFPILLMMVYFMHYLLCYICILWQLRINTIQNVLLDKFQHHFHLEALTHEEGPILIIHLLFLILQMYLQQLLHFLILITLFFLHLIWFSLLFK